MKFKEEILEKLFILITGALSLVTALAWNEAMRALFKGPCEIPEAGALCHLYVGGPWIYAILVTIFSVFMILMITKLLKKEN
ncbi:hypothetical protein HNV12_02285 [Methanococcoides sp. SA1]|nr:hypothetical protein [Methanococcoides sp. SA1]